MSKERKADKIAVGVVGVIGGAFMLPPLIVMAGLGLAGKGLEESYKFLKKRHEKVLAIEMEKEKERQKERERKEAIKEERRKYIR